MPQTIQQTGSFPVEDFLAPTNVERLDAIVTEVFGMMLAYTTTPIDPVTSPHTEATGTTEKTALVGFSGAMRGLCEVRTGFYAARAIASAMLGGVEADEDSIDDALGEVCNMLAGGWKNSVPTLSSLCSLSPPTVISGRDYKVHIGSPSIKLSRSYAFDTHTFQLTLHRQTV